MKFPRVTFGKVLGGTAVVLALTTGTAFAAATVNSGDIVNGTVRSLDIRTGGVKSVDVLNNSLAAGDLAPGSVGQSEVATGAVGDDEIADDAVDGSEVVDGSLGRENLSFNIPITRTAYVQADGTLTRGIGAVGAVRTGVGAYTVTFDWLVGTCTASVTGFGNAVDAAVHGLSGTTLSVDLEDPDQENAQVDNAFFVTVVCPT